MSKDGRKDLMRDDDRRHDDDPHADRDADHSKAALAAGGTDSAGIEGMHSGAGTGASHGNLPERFDNPGLPQHHHRMADTDPKAARTAERQVATLFVLSMVGTIIFIAAYFAIPLDSETDRIGQVQLSNLLLGGGLGLALFCIGIGAVHWAKTLMPDEEVVEDRHSVRGTEEERTQAVGILQQGSAESGIGRRPLIAGSLLGAVGIVPLTGVVVLGDLGPLPGDSLTHTLWDEGVRLVGDVQRTPIRAADVTIGSVFHIVPENLAQSSHPLEEKAKAAVILIRLGPEQLEEDADKVDWSYDGIVAYSKICTHVGCPVALYEQTTHHLLCPCHQSIFDVVRHCKVIFGPASRPLPQLPITVDDEGYLIARSDFQEPVGPSFWERG